MTDLPGAVLQAAAVAHCWDGCATERQRARNAALCDAALEAVSGSDRVPRRGYLPNALAVAFGRSVICQRARRRPGAGAGVLAIVGHRNTCHESSAISLDPL